jgi:GNAT superfamily N-acetyltransferase
MAEGWTTAPASELTLAKLADLFTAGFAGYVIAMRMTAAGLADRVCSEDIHLVSSRVVLRGTEPVGLGLVSRRGRQSRLAAMGVIPEARSRGAGRVLLSELLEEARARRDARMRLEVFEANAQARALYERSGFRLTTRLVGYELQQPRAAVEDLREVDPTEFARQLGKEDVGALPWQLEPATLSTPPSGARCFSLEEKCFAYVPAVSDQAISLRGLLTVREHRRRGLASRMIGALAAEFPGRRVSVPQLVPEGLGAAFFAARGFDRGPLPLLELALPFG